MPVVDPFPEDMILDMKIKKEKKYNIDMDERTFAQQVIHDFIQELDIRPRYEYSLKEMKSILSDIYTSKKTIVFQQQKANRHPRKLTTYNVYVKHRMTIIKEEYPEIPSRDRMSLIAKEWREFSPEEKADFKSNIV